MNALAHSVLAVLPQTQCTRCGYPDCAAYAQAIALGTAAINQCPPGGAQGIAFLATITGQSVLPLNPVNGMEAPRRVALIDEDWCIGCTLCITACPTDAIVGSNKLMHTVIEAYCTGCELCLPVCPVDCIDLENVTGSATGWDAWSQTQADLARSRYASSNERRRRELSDDNQRREAKTAPRGANLSHPPSPIDALMVDKKRSVIQAALQRARAQRVPAGSDK